MYSPVVLTISQLNAYVHSIIEQDEKLNMVFAVGEISNFVCHYKSGHMYMTLKDGSCAIKAVMFAGNASRLRFKPENGMSVIIRGRVSVYEREGQYQLYIDDMQPDGVGALSLAFEQIKEKLAKAGLFDESAKKAIPRFPSKIGVITSPTGAAVQDIINVLSRRCPSAEVLIYGVQVQGDTSAAQIGNAVSELNKRTDIDVIIIARGGGSIEDLWPFNDERVAYAIYNSRIPIISGVGHETDYTVCDLVADLRAPTPSAAAELAVLDSQEQRFYIQSLKNTIYSLIEDKINFLEHRLKISESNVLLKNPYSVIDNCEMYLDSVYNKLNTVFLQKLNKYSSDFSVLCSSLDALSPLKVLARGYSIVRNSNSIISSSENLKTGDEIEIIFTTGKAKGKILEVRNENDI